MAMWQNREDLHCFGEGIDSGQKRKRNLVGHRPVMAGFGMVLF